MSQARLDIDEVTATLRVVEDARLADRRRAVDPLLRQLAGRLGVAELGVDVHGFWLRFEVADASARLRWIWPGRFEMGSPDDEPGRFDDEGPVHPVVLTRGLWIGETPVTGPLYRAVTGSSPQTVGGPSGPVAAISWYDSRGFCDQLHERLPSLAFRLPTEAEWEYVARAGTVGPAPPGGANPWGLHDLFGTVSQWCLDSVDPSDAWQLPRYDPDERIDPAGTRGGYRALRGGSPVVGPPRAAYRDALPPHNRRPTLGLRLAADPGPARHR